MLEDGCVEYLESMVDKSKEVKISPTQVPVVQKFVEVFPRKLSGLLPERKISFEIKFLSETGPISNAPYKMVPTELKEFQTQLQELLGKGFIHPSISPWDVHVLL